MKPIRAWQGVRLRRLSIGYDPEAALRQVTLPASWDDSAAAALAQLAPGEGAASLAIVAEGWIRPVAERARRSGIELAVADALHALLRRRQGAPSAGIWRGEVEDVPGFVLNLASFHDAAVGFDLAAFTAAIDLAVTTLTLAAPASRRIGVAMSDLAGLLACLGLAYDSVAARDLAACLAALLRARADAQSATLAGLFGVATADAALPPAPPDICVVPGLAAAAAEAWNSRPHLGLRHDATTAIAEAGPVEALLGVETGGIAAAFSPLACGGGLTRTARAALAARGLTAEAALADLIGGIDHFPAAPAAARVAMWEAVAPYLQLLPKLRLPEDAKAAATGRRELPARRRGYAQRAAVGGHTLFIRTGEYQDGRLGEITLTPLKESAPFRGLMDSFAQAVSIGLQHGIPLDEYVEAFTNTRFGASGTVEGDPGVERATSLLDYAFRHLAVNYLGRADVPPAMDEDGSAATPLLPLDLPQDEARRARRGRLRVVGA